MAVSIAKLAIHLTTDTLGMSKGFRAATGEVTTFSGKITALANTHAFSIMTAEATAFTGVLAMIVKEGIRVNMAIERMQAALGGFLRDEAGAASLIADMRAFDKVSPLGFEEIAEGAKALLGTGSDIRHLRGELYMLGEVAAGSGKNIEELAVIYSQIKAKGRLVAQDEHQLTSALIPIVLQLQKNLGVTATEYEKLREAGRITAADVTKAFADMVSAGGILAGQSERYAETTAASWAKLKTTFSEMAEEETKSIPGKGAMQFGQLLLEAQKFYAVVLQGEKSLADLMAKMHKDKSDEKYGAGKQKEIEALKRSADEDQKAADAIRKRKEEEEAAAKAAKSRIDDLKRDADRLKEAIRTPFEAYRDSIEKFKEMFLEGLLTAEEFHRAADRAAKQLEKFEVDADIPAAAKKAAIVNNPALLKGTQAQLSAVNNARAGIENRNAAEIRKQTQLAKEVSKNTAGILDAVKSQKPVTIKQVGLT